VRRLVATLLASLLALPLAIAAGVSPGQRALLLLRVLAYDRALRSRAGDAVQVAVVYQAGAAASEAERDDLLVAFADVARTVVVGGRPVRAVPVPWRGGAELEALLAARRASAVYACPGLLEAAGEIEAAARRQRALTFAGDGAFVERGFAVALVDRGRRAGVLVAPAVAAAEGADLDSALLSLAELYDGGATGAGPRPRPPAGDPR